MEELFDFCLLGTGLVNAILAGALSRAGSKVLVLDSGDHYKNAKPVRLASGDVVAENQTVLKTNGRMVELLVRSGGEF